jgi:hypothetical protein
MRFFYLQGVASHGTYLWLEGTSGLISRYDPETRLERISTNHSQDSCHTRVSQGKFKLDRPAWPAPLTSLSRDNVEAHICLYGSGIAVR